MHKMKEDTYILVRVLSTLEELQDQKKRGFNPGVEAILKDASTHEIIKVRLNLDDIEEIKERPGSFRFTGIVSEGFRISDYYYNQETPIEGYASGNEDDVCAIHVASRGRQPRSYVSPYERKKMLAEIQASRAIYSHTMQRIAFSTV